MRVSSARMAVSTTEIGILIFVKWSVVCAQNDVYQDKK